MPTEDGVKGIMFFGLSIPLSIGKTEGKRKTNEV